MYHAFFGTTLYATFRDILTLPVFDNIPLWRFLFATLALVIAFVSKWTLRWLTNRVMIKIVGRPDKHFEEITFTAIREPISGTILLLGFDFATRVTIHSAPDLVELSRAASTAYEVAMVLLIIWAIYRLVDLPIAFLQSRAKTASPIILALIANSLRVLIIVLGFVTLLANLKVNIVSLLAGLGVGGLAVALALQDPLGNFFGFIALLSDYPFKVGDWIQMGSSSNRVDGIVEYVGFRSTRIRTFTKSVLIIPNNLLSKDIIENFSAIHLRRVKQTLLLSYQTSPESMRHFLADLRALIADDPEIDQDQTFIFFDDITGGGYEVLIMYYTKPVTYLPYLTVKERINLSIIELARKHDLAFVSTTTPGLSVKPKPAPPSTT